MEEIWKDIPGFEGYQASNLGRIKSLKNGKEKFIGSVEIKKNGYKRPKVKLNGYSAAIGRFILIAFDRYPNEGDECDHIDRNSTNNRLDNLRWVSRNENLLNRSNYGNSKLKGVSKCSTNYMRKNGTKGKSIVIRAQITINKKRICLGNFKTEEAAHEAYKKAYLNHYGYEWMG